MHLLSDKNADQVLKCEINLLQCISNKRGMEKKIDTNFWTAFTVKSEYMIQSFINQCYT